jgi:hypothetical protein
MRKLDQLRKRVIVIRWYAKIPRIIKKMYLKYSNNFETSVPLKSSHPVTRCNDLSATPTAGNIV